MERDRVSTWFLSEVAEIVGDVVNEGTGEQGVEMVVPSRRDTPQRSPSCQR